MGTVKIITLKLPVDSKNIGEHYGQHDHINQE